MERPILKVEEELDKEKPKFLYHGSRHRGLDELEPKAHRHRDPGEGERVFATQDLAMATIFMARTYKGCGIFGDVVYAYIIEPREEFIEDDKGGHVYVLPSDNFVSDPNKGLGKYEWTSDVKVKPVDKIEFPSTLDAMIENGVQVYFIDQETHERIDKADDHGLSIFESLESENQRRGTNVRVFPK